MVNISEEFTQKDMDALVGTHKGIGELEIKLGEEKVKKEAFLDNLYEHGSNEHLTQACSTGIIDKYDERMKGRYVAYQEGSDYFVGRISIETNSQDQAHVDPKILHLDADNEFVLIDYKNRGSPYNSHHDIDIKDLMFVDHRSQDELKKAYDTLVERYADSKKTE